MTKNIILIILFIIIFSGNLYAQEIKDTSSRNFYLSAKLHYGFIYDHRNTVNYLLKRHSTAVSLQWGIPTKGDKQWQIERNNPTVGVGYYCSDLGNYDILGIVNSGYGFIDVPFVRKKKISLNYNIAFGLAHLSKKFDAEKNYMNRSIGSHFNVHINFGFDAKFKIGNRTELTTGLCFTHFSNGKIATPNLGINIASLYTGINYRFGNEVIKLQEIEKAKPIFEKHNEYSIIYSLGLKERYPPGEKKYFVTSLSANYERVFNYKRLAGFGIDYFYDGSIRSWLENAGNENVSETDLMYIGAHGSYGFIFGQTIISLEAGFYLYSSWKPFGYIYQRVRIRYKFSDRFFASIAVKSYLAKADFVEWGLGYYWNK